MENDEHGRHWDTLCISLMTLATAVMAGLFVFLRFPVLDASAKGKYSISEAVVILGVIFAGMLYSGCIWWGMGILANSDLHGKFYLSGYLRFLVILLVLVVVAVILAGIHTHLEAGELTSGNLRGGGAPVVVQ